MQNESRYSEFEELADSVKEELTRRIEKDVDEVDQRAVVLSNVLNVAWTKFDEYESGTNFRAWIYAIYRNMLNEYWRKLTEARARIPRKNNGGIDDSSGDDDAWRSEVVESGLIHDHIEIGRFDPDSDTKFWSAIDTGTAQSDDGSSDPDSIAAQPTENTERADDHDGFIEITGDLAVSYDLSKLGPDMEAALKELTDNERRVFLERNIFGRTQQEVADDLNLKQNSVKGHHSNALRKIHSRLGYEFYKKYPELMTAGLVAFPSEQPASYVSYLLVGLMKEYLQRFDPVDQEMWDTAINTIRARITGEKPETGNDTMIN